MQLAQDFDAVVMLTWSDWHREPRSNRYHYATRFAKELPVVFVQPDLHALTTDRTVGYMLEKVEGYDITILHVSDHYGPQQTKYLFTALEQLQVRNPLLWIYNVYFEHFIRRSQSRLKIYHATETYLTPVSSVVIAGDSGHPTIRRVLDECDLMVSVSQGVEDEYRKHGPYTGPGLVLNNGCDYATWHDSGAAEYEPPENNAKVALFHGGINGRLDYDLLARLADALPDWELWFCGWTYDAPAAWNDLRQRPNVRHFERTDANGVAALSKRSLVGIIPFQQETVMRVSLPLKAYEYVACGLPVVTIPIDALAARPDLFRTETTAEGFAAAIRALAPSRTDPAAIASRQKEARLQSYDERFEALKGYLRDLPVQRRAERSEPGCLLMLYDYQSVQVRTVEEHLQAFRKYSRHRVVFMPATGYIPGVDDAPRPPDFGIFDAIAIHYSVRVSIPDHLSLAIAEAVRAFDGPKILFIQDEYDTTETARRWMEKLGIDAVFTCVPPDFVDAVYPGERFPKVDFIPNLTGYVPEDPSIDRHALPIEERPIVIGYRGRELPHQYGDLGHEKYRIGVDVKRLAEERGVPVDIEVDGSRRIYGNAWYRFIGSCRATLGTESGANVFDDDGALARLASKHADMPYERFKRLFLGPYEGKVRMNQVSPKIFESIRLRTALVLFEGTYSGVVTPDAHFIPLKKDYSNIDDVFAKLADLDYLKALTDRAYADVIGSGRYSYATFIQEVDAYLDKRLASRRPRVIAMTPIFGRFGTSGAMEPLADSGAAYLMMSDRLIASNTDRQAFFAGVQSMRSAFSASAEQAIAQASLDPNAPPNVLAVTPSMKVIAFLMARRLWHTLPTPTRGRLGARAKTALRQYRDDPSTLGPLERFMIRRLPDGLRSALSRLVG